MTASIDAVLFGLLSVAAVSLIAAVSQMSRGRSSRPYIVPVFGALALAIVWGAVAETVGLDNGRAGGAEASIASAEIHDHENMFADDGDLPGSDMLAQHLVHLRETDLVVTDEQKVAADILASATRRATARYGQLAVAQAEGYVTLTGANGNRDPVYLYDREFVREGTWIEPGRPQALVYLRAPDRIYQLVGAAFLTPAGDGPRIGGGLTIWFPHRELCLDEQQYVVARTASGSSCPTGTQLLGWRPEALYVWLFDNPNGLFAGGLTREAAEVARRQRITG